MDFGKGKVVEGSIDTSNGIVFDPAEGYGELGGLNVEKLTDDVYEIMNYMASGDIMKMRKDNFVSYSQHMEDKFKDFSDEYFSLFQMIISGENIAPLFKMLTQLENVQSGKISFTDAEKNVGKQIRTFLPPELRNQK